MNQCCWRVDHREVRIFGRKGLFMGTDDDAESCSSRPVDFSPKAPRNHQHLKLEVFNDVLSRLQDSDFHDAKIHGFDDQLWLHFNRFPARYALEVNVERAEDVLTHMRLLRQAEEPDNVLAYHVSVVQVNLTTIGHIGDSMHSYCSMDEGSQGSVKNDVGLGLSLSLHPPPTFNSIPSFETQGVNFDVEDRDSVANAAISQSSRAMHEITFSTVDKPKLLNQLTSLLSEMSLNIQEAHAFSTVDGFSLDVFVVDGWPHEETEQLRSLLDNEIKKLEQPLSQELSWAAVGEHHLKAVEVEGKVEGTTGRIDEVDIDQRLLKVGNKVASGSHADLYKGTYCGQFVAVKVLKSVHVNSDVVKEFYQEVKIMRKLQHKNVVQFIGACTKPPNLFLLTEFVPEGNLYDFMHKRKSVFKLQTLLRAAIDVSMGMEYLHQNDIIHRDLKTANLLMCEGVVKVADFGVAKVQTQSGVMTAETGTYRWMAPEVIGHKSYDHKADVFSFGVVLWELLTSELPYSSLTPVQAAIGVVQKGLRPPIPKHTHPKLADLMERCWHQDPTLRPNFLEVTEILQQITNEVVEVGNCHDISAGEGFLSSNVLISNAAGH